MKRLSSITLLLAVLGVVLASHLYKVTPTPPSADEAEEKLEPFLRSAENSWWERRHRDLTMSEPFLRLIEVLLVGVIGVILGWQAILIADRTADVEEQQAVLFEKQTKLLEQQTEMQASQQLPRFSFSLDSDDRDSHVLMIRTDLGTARGVSVETKCSLTLTIDKRTPLEYKTFGPQCTGYFPGYIPLLTFYDREATIGISNNRSNFASLKENVEAILIPQYPSGHVDLFMHVIVSISYSDYADVERQQSHMLSIVPDQNPSLVSVEPLTKRLDDGIHDLFESSEISVDLASAHDPSVAESLLANWNVTTPATQTP